MTNLVLAALFAAGLIHVTRGAPQANGTDAVNDGNGTTQTNGDQISVCCVCPRVPRGSTGVRRSSCGINQQCYCELQGSGGYVQKLCDDGHVLKEGECVQNKRGGDGEDRAATEEAEDDDVEEPRHLQPLGRPVTLGAMYNARTDTFYEDTSFWSPTTIEENKIMDTRQQETKTSVLTSKSVKERTESLDINAELSISVMAGLIKVSGSAGYLSDKVSKTNEENVDLYYHTTKFKSYIPVFTPKDYAEDICKNKVFTHAVTSITYGLDAHFVFKKLVQEHEDTSSISGRLQVIVKSIPSFEIEAMAEISMSEEDKTLMQTSSLQMYGDFSPTEPLPTSFEDAVSFYKELPTFAGDKYNDYEGAAPVLVKITPVSTLCEENDVIVASISAGIIEGVVDMLDELQQLDMRVGELLSRSSAISFAAIGNNLKTYRNAMDKYKLSVTTNLQDLLPKIRNGDSETAILNLISDHKESQFNERKSGVYLSDREREIAAVDIVLLNYPSDEASNIDIVDYEKATDVEYLFNRNKVIIANFNVLAPSTVTTDFLNGEDSVTSDNSAWYDDAATTGDIGAIIRDYGIFAMANKEKADRGYLIKINLQDEDKEPLEISSYLRGQQQQVQYTVQSEAPDATIEKIGTTDIFLSITRPKLIVTGCNFTIGLISYYETTIDEKTESKQMIERVSKVVNFIEATKENDQQLFYLDGLKAFSEYEMTVEYVTDMGMSPSTRIGNPDTVRTRPTTPPQNLQLTDGGRLPTSLTFSWFAPSTKPDSISYQNIKYKILVTSGGKCESENWLAVGGRCFSFSSVQANHADAQAACQAKGSVLASILSEEENEWIASNSAEEKFYWLGGTDETTEGIWQWPNGELIELNNWATSAQTGKEPNNQGASGGYADYMILYNSKWYDYNEEFSAHYICSKPGMDYWENAYMTDGGELTFTANQLSEVVLYNISVTAVVTVGEIVFESITTSKQFATVPVAPTISVEPNSVTSSAALIKWTPPTSLLADATITGFTVAYSHDRFSSHPEMVNVEGHVREFLVQNLVMGTAYQFKVKMNMGPKWGETQYSSEMDITTSETDTTEVQKLQEKLEATLDGKIDAAKEELRSESSSTYPTKATLTGKIEEIEVETTAAGTQLTNLEATLNGKIEEIKMRGRKSSICGYQSYWNHGVTITYETVHTEVNEVESVLTANTGIYTAGVDGVYEISLSGYSVVYPEEKAEVWLDGAGYGDEDKRFIYSYNSRSNGGYIQDTAAATRHVTLTAGRHIRLKYDGTATFWRIKFCVTLY